MNSPYYSSTSFQKQPNTHHCNILTIALRSNALGKINIPSVLFAIWFMGNCSILSYDGLIICNQKHSVKRFLSDNGMIIKKKANPQMYADERR